MYMNHVKLPNVDVMLLFLLKKKKKKAMYRFSLTWTFHVLLKKVLRWDMEEKRDARVPQYADESLEGGWGVEATGLVPFPAEGGSRTTARSTRLQPWQTLAFPRPTLQPP